MASDPSLNHFSIDEFKEFAKADDSFTKDVFQTEERLTKKELFARLDTYSDIYLTFDWGRDYGIDNAQRVSEISNHLTKKSYSFMKNKEKMSKCHFGVVMLTDRYLRRYREKAYIKEEFDSLKNTVPMARLLFVLLEGRVKSKFNSIIRELGVVTTSADDTSSVHSVDVADFDHNLFGVVMERLENSLPFPSLHMIKRRLDSIAKKDIFKAIAEGKADLLDESLNKGYCSVNDRNDDSLLKEVQLSKAKPTV